mmetsp:Transcript_20790/g.60496  ORF Transcript_20790/g.60496 Transcript_20790/m.60496 type:complete len:92 (-) Transcript_20790:209-484(-)
MPLLFVSSSRTIAASELGNTLDIQLFFESKILAYELVVERIIRKEMLRWKLVIFLNRYDLLSAWLHHWTANLVFRRRLRTYHFHTPGIEAA